MREREGEDNNENHEHPDYICKNGTQASQGAATRNSATLQPHGNGTRGTLLVRSILARFPFFFFSHTDTETKTTTEAGIFISSVLLLS